MAGIDLNSYKELYLKTAREHLTHLKTEVELIKQNTDKASILADIHRRFHSLKSQSLIMGNPSLGGLAKTLELFFKQIIESKKFPTTDQIMLVEKAVTEMNLSLDEIEKNNKELDLNSIAQKLSDQFSMQSVMSKLHSLGISK